MALSVGSALVVTVLMGWHNGLGLAIGAIVAYVNMIWLHRASKTMVERAVASIALSSTGTSLAAAHRSDAGSSKDAPDIGTESTLTGSPATPSSSPAKLPSILAFTGRYAFLIAISSVILTSLPSMRFGFVMALFAPILAAMGEGVYEACASGRANEISRE